MFSFLGINGDFGRFSLYLKVEHLALFNFSIYTIIRTPPDHPVTTNELVEFFAEASANAARKTVKDDIDVLIEEGYDIVT